jgi:hypothetical protein
LALAKTGEIGHDRSVNHIQCQRDSIPASKQQAQHHHNKRSLPLKDVLFSTTSFPYFSGCWRSGFLLMRTHFRVSSFGDTAGRVHSIKKTTSVFYGNSDDVSERGKMILKALEKKHAENMDLRFAQVITKIDTATEALNKKIDTTAEALITKIEKIETNTEALVTKIDTLYVGLVVIFCLILSDKFPSLIAALLKQ